MNRRRFLHQVEVLAGGALCSALPLAVVPLLTSACAARVRYSTPTIVGDRLMVRIADITSGSLLIEDPQSALPIFLHRSATGAFTAVSTKCTHRGCQVEPDAERLVCPCHGSTYTLAGTVTHGPAERALPSYRVTANAESVFIYLVEGAS